MDEKFKLIDENGIKKEAEILTSFAYKVKRERITLRPLFC